VFIESIAIAEAAQIYGSGKHHKSGSDECALVVKAPCRFEPCPDHQITKET